MDIKKEAQEAASEGVGTFFDGLMFPFTVIGWIWDLFFDRPSR